LTESYNRNIGLKIGKLTRKSGSFRENRESWQACVNQCWCRWSDHSQKYFGTLMYRKQP